MQVPAPTPPAEEFLLSVTLKTSDGLTGHGLTTVNRAGLPAVQGQIAGPLAELIREASWTDPREMWSQAEALFQGAGFRGLAARAYTAIDLALWDLQSRQTGVALADRLGGRRELPRHFVTGHSGPHWHADEVAKAARSAVKAGAIGIRVEVGTEDVQADADRIRDLHDAVGDESWLGVSARGRYDLNTALALAHFFEDQGVDWFEDPIPMTDRIGYAKIASRVEIPVAVGSTIDSVPDLLHMIREGVIRIVRPNLVRLGGLTPVLTLATVADAFQVGISPVGVPVLGPVLARGLKAVLHWEQVPWYEELLPTAADLTTPGAIPAIAEEQRKKYHVDAAG